MKEGKTYVVVRDTLGKNGRHYRRYTSYEVEEIARMHVIEYCEDNTTMSIYELAGEVEKKADVMNVGTLVFQKVGIKVVYDREVEAKKAAAGGDDAPTTEESSVVAPETATLEENSKVAASDESELAEMPDVLPDPKIDTSIDRQKGNDRAIKSHLLNNLQDKLHKLGYRDIFLYLNAKETVAKILYHLEEQEETLDITGLAPSAVGRAVWEGVNKHLKRLRRCGRIA